MAAGTDPGSINLEDIQTFLAACELLEQLDTSKRLTFLQLAKEMDVKYTTAMGQLERIVDYFFGTKYKPPGRSSGLELLFAAKAKGGPLSLTPIADELRPRLATLRDLYSECRTVVQLAAEQKLRGSQVRPTVRLGCPHTIGLYLASYVYSGWEEYFGEYLDLKVELGNTTDLVGKVAIRLLDFVIGFGNQNKTVQDKKLPVKFVSFGEYSRMVLACPGSGPRHYAAVEAAERSCQRIRMPLEKISVNPANTKDAERPSKGFRPVYLKHFEPKNTPLIVVPSHGQIKELNTVVDNWEKRSTVIRVASYNDAISLVRMGLGIAPVTESFAVRSGLMFFRMEPEEDFRRWIGCYYHSNVALTPEAEDLILFLRTYLTELRVRLFMREPLPSAPSLAYSQVFEKFRKKTQAD